MTGKMAAAPPSDPAVTLRMAEPSAGAIASGLVGPMCEPGRWLGRYQLLDLLGQGAMGSVFRARDPRLSRLVAIKTMNLSVAGRSGMAERFRREAQAAAALRHPGIPEIYDFALATEGEPAYIVSQLISGPTLRQFLDRRRGRILPESAALIGGQLAQALQVAHAGGVVHRDIKPDNVMLECRSHEGRVLLTDFGVARLVGSANPGSASGGLDSTSGGEAMTVAGTLVGSPAYMSPEQARGEPAGPASDQWALGVLLYEMATGRLPFGKASFAAGERAFCRPPSRISPHAGPSFDEICMRCLHPSPHERYPNMGAVVERLHRVVKEAGIEPEPLVLRRLLSDPDGFESELRPKVADQATHLARCWLRRGAVARALGEISRAKAYVARHRGAESLFSAIDSNIGTLNRVAVVTAALAAILLAPITPGVTELAAAALLLVGRRSPGW